MLYCLSYSRSKLVQLTKGLGTAKIDNMSKEFSAIKAGVGMFAAAPVIGALCPAINAVTAGGSLAGVLPEGMTGKLAEGFSGVAAGAQERVAGLLAGLRGSGLGANLGGGMFAGGLTCPSQLGLGQLEGSLSRVADMARRGL